MKIINWLRKKKEPEPEPDRKIDPFYTCPVCGGELWIVVKNVDDPDERILLRCMKCRKKYEQIPALREIVE